MADAKPQVRKLVPTNAGAAWTAEQEEELAAAYNGGASIKEIATAMERTNGAIKSRLQKIGLLPL